MRRMIALLEEYRCEQLKVTGQVSRIQEVRDMYRFMDGALSNVSLGGRNGETWDSPYSKLSEVMTSGDFTYALGEFVSRRMQPGYLEKSFAFEPLVRMDTNPNLMDASDYQSRSGLDDLELVTEKGTPKAGYKADAVKRTTRVFVWEKQWDFSMRAIINDQLGYFNNQAVEMGRSARRTLERYVSRMYNNATSIARLTGQGVLFATTGRLTSARIAAAMMAFNQRVDARNAPLVANLQYIVYPSALKSTILTIQASTLVPELATNAANVVASAFTPIEDPHIAVTAPNIPWWAFVNPAISNIVPLVLVRRDGMPAPILTRKVSDQQYFASFAAAGAAAPPILGDFETGNIVVKAHDEWGTYIDGTNGNLYDDRGAYYSSGTTP